MSTFEREWVLKYLIIYIEILSEWNMNDFLNRKIINRFQLFVRGTYIVHAFINIYILNANHTLKLIRV